MNGHSSDTQVAESRQIDSCESRQIHSHETHESPEERTDTDQTLKFLLTEAFEVAANARREVGRETLRRNNAEAAAMRSARKFAAMEDALQDAIFVSKMKDDKCQELTRRIKEVEEKLQAVVHDGRSQAAKISHERDQAVLELHAAEQKLRAVEMQNSRILREKQLKINELQDFVHSRSGLETPSSYSMQYFSENIKPASVKSTKEFNREIDILREIRHPNLVKIVGACSEQGCILYEYMTNGTLADRLISCKDSTPPLPWRTRICIAADVCSGLQYLHNIKPDPIVHLYLKPDNIFLEKNYVAKIGHIRLARRLPRELQGTILYMDPEYLRNGDCSTKSDVFSLGMILLELLTGKAALGLVKEVESAVENSKLDEILDASAGEWPFALAAQLADLALHCTKVVRNIRPDIQPTVMQMLDKLRNLAVDAPENGRAGNAEETNDVPGFFLCPILMTVMRDPCIAADGFTYERGAIQEWFDSGNKTSPMTNKKLKREDLVPNYSLRSAIRQWQEETKLLRE